MRAQVRTDDLQAKIRGQIRGQIRAIDWPDGPRQPGTFEAETTVKDPKESRTGEGKQGWRFVRDGEWVGSGRWFGR
jgi:hypothetical protein